MLEVSGLTVRFGGVTALHDVELRRRRRRVCGLIGPNGAGKTTLFNCISRLAEPGGGLDPLRRHGPARPRAHEIAALGIARTFQHLGARPVAERARERDARRPPPRPLRLPAAALHLPDGPPRGARDARATPTRRSSASACDQLADRPVAGLAYGAAQARRARARACERPRLLMLDEPASGLSHGEVDELADAARAARATSST